MTVEYNLPPSSGQNHDPILGHGRIPHFDATARRRERMRALSAESSGSGDTANLSKAKNGAGHVTAGSIPGLKSPGVNHSETAKSSGLPQSSILIIDQLASPFPSTRSTSVEQDRREDGLLPNAAARTPLSFGKSTTGDLKPQPAEGMPTAPSLRGLELEKFLVEFVVEQTGYPPEMIDLDADLEADLGIDSIKKAQLLGEMAERIDIDLSQVSQLSLDDFPTLRHVKDFLDTDVSFACKVGYSDSTGGAAMDAPTRATVPPMAAPSQSREKDAGGELSPHESFTPVSKLGLPQFAGLSSRVPPAAVVAAVPKVSNLRGHELERFLVDFVVEQTGYPSEMVDLNADLEADLGIDSIKKAQLLGELSEHFSLQISDVSHLSLDDFPTLGHVKEFLEAISLSQTGESGRSQT